MLEQKGPQGVVGVPGGQQGRWNGPRAVGAVRAALRLARRATVAALPHVAAAKIDDVVDVVVTVLSPQGAAELRARVHAVAQARDEAVAREGGAAVHLGVAFGVRAEPLKDGHLLLGAHAADEHLGRRPDADRRDGLDWGLHQRIEEHAAGTWRRRPQRPQHTLRTALVAARHAEGTHAGVHARVPRVGEARGAEDGQCLGVHPRLQKHRHVVEVVPKPSVREVDVPAALVLARGLHSAALEHDHAVGVHVQLRQRRKDQCNGGRDGLVERRLAAAVRKVSVEVQVQASRAVVANELVEGTLGAQLDVVVQVGVGSDDPVLLGVVFRSLLVGYKHELALGVRVLQGLALRPGKMEPTRLRTSALHRALSNDALLGN